MKVTSVGHNFIHNKPFSVDRPKGSGDNLMVFVKKETLFKLKGERVKAGPNSLIIYEVGTPQYYEGEEETFVNDWFHFTMEGETDFFNCLYIPYDTILSGLDTNFISNSIFELSNEFNSSRVNREKIIDMELKIFFLKVSQMIQENNSFKKYDKYYESFNNIRNQIYNEPYNKFEILDFAKRIDLSLSHFQHTYKALFGVSCKADIIKSKLNYAKYHLSINDYKIGYVAYLCGFENEEHFMRLFKKHLGLTPSEYRHREHKII